MSQSGPETISEGESTYTHTHTHTHTYPHTHTKHGFVMYIEKLAQTSLHYKSALQLHISVDRAPGHISPSSDNTLPIL